MLSHGLTNASCSTPHPFPSPSDAKSEGLHLAIAEALRLGDRGLAQLGSSTPNDRLDTALALGLIHDLHLAPIESLGDLVRWQHHPVVADLKHNLEIRFIASLEQADHDADWNLPDDPVAAIRTVAARDLVPSIYQWVARAADEGELRRFLTFEGGPDGGFDDLVASCQIGLHGDAKLELARNYWDEMGRGQAEDVHTELYRSFVRAMHIPAIPRVQQPIEAIERSLLGSLLATNRYLQPEMVGALGTIELQAGPRCRNVVRAMERLDVPCEARRFYDEHATTDPRHGKDWLDNAVRSLAGDEGWATGMVRGARWRWLVNKRLFTWLETELTGVDFPAGGSLQPQASAA